LSARDALAVAAGVRGRLREAERNFTQATEMRLRVRGDTVSPYDIAFFHSMVDGLVRGDSARGSAALDAVLRARPVTGLPLERDPSVRLAQAYARLGDAKKARELMNQHEARLDATHRRQEAVALARLRGSIAQAEGKADSAVAWFRAGDADADGLPTADCPVCTVLGIGMSFDRGGQADSARKYLTQYVDMTGGSRQFVDRFFLASALFRLGELYENAGDARRATDYYGRFVDLWANADPELQPRVANARARIDHLNRTKR
jgi:tetratricopeptide (TPR) repeat protein